jgi:hypothetical protein
MHVALLTVQDLPKCLWAAKHLLLVKNARMRRLAEAHDSARAPWSLPLPKER